jgi:3-methyladenine DNA glycosylase AlkD
MPTGKTTKSGGREMAGTVTVADEVIRELESLGTEQNRKIYKRHGVGDNQYGVSYANLYAIVKRIKTDHRLAQELWASGNHDARILATMVADPKEMSAAEIEAWMDDLDNYGLTDALTGVVARSPHARDKMEEWRRSDEEWRGSAGWQLVGNLAMNDKTIPDEYFEKALQTIERDIHSAKNRVRYAMNWAVIGIGMRSEDLKQKAIAAAERIGVVYVDHGETGCKTPDAASYIVKASERKRGGISHLLSAK